MLAILESPVNAPGPHIRLWCGDIGSLLQVIDSGIHGKRQRRKIDANN